MMHHPFDEEALHWAEPVAAPTWRRIVVNAVAALIGGFVMLLGVVAWVS